MIIINNDNNDACDKDKNDINDDDEDNGIDSNDNIQIMHCSEGISKNYSHKVSSEQSNTHKAVAKGVWIVSKVPSVGNFTNARTKCCVLFVLYNYDVDPCYLINHPHHSPSFLQSKAFQT